MTQKSSQHTWNAYFGTDAIRTDLNEDTPDDSRHESKEEQQVFEDTFEMSLAKCETRHANAEKMTPFISACDVQLSHLARLFLQADELQDVVTANVVIDEIIRFLDVADRKKTTKK